MRSLRLSSRLLALAFGGALGAAARASEPVDYSRDVLPILSANCFRCHGRDAAAREAHLRLDQREEATLRRDDGITPIAPGHPETSEIIARITSRDATQRMPPADEGRALHATEIATLRSWIAQGANYAEHWAWRPLSPHAPGSVDAFIRARLEKENLAPAPLASRATLLRRAALDLTGLLPTPAEIDAFVGDKSGDDVAFARVVDRLLASPHYGERYGRHWLDVARYADSAGYDRDFFFGHAWRYRDYVFRAFNADKPFDRFIQEQIAGDELFPGDAEAAVATGFFTVGPVPHVPNMDPARRAYDQHTDFADTTGSAFLGLTVSCARCHDHKFDPISQKDYFALQAVFAASDQIDYYAGGKKIREHAAQFPLHLEFAAEQARQWLRSETDPARRTELLRQIGDAYATTDGGYELTRRYNRTQNALRDFYVDGRLLKPETVLKDRDDDDNDTLALKAELRGFLSDRPTDLSDAKLLAVGAVALLHPTPLPTSLFKKATPAADDPGFGSVEKFRELKEREAKLGYLTALGRHQKDRPKPDGYRDDLEKLRAEIGERHLNDPSPLPLRMLGHRAQPLETRLLKRGELTAPGERVEPAVLEKFAAGFSFAGVPPERRRAALATWIASEKNVLTARVIANRVWQWHFGAGLVRTPDDFGVRGELPSHPELLDWLAGELIAHQWSLKHLHRVIMNSATYRQAATADAAALARDPDNRLLARFQPYRLEAEVIWDSLRVAAGTLDLTLYGMPVVPPLEERFSGDGQIATSPPAEVRRRAVYYVSRRSFRQPMFNAFDVPFGFTPCGQRENSTTPLQALTLLNQKATREHAADFAERLLRETRQQLAPIPALAWRYAYGREITPEERNAAAALLLKARAGEGGAVDPKMAVTDLCHALFNTNEFIYQQ